jgi:hypothetical protein
LRLRKIKEGGQLAYRLRTALRTRLYLAIKGGYRNGSAVRDLGCSIEQFKQHIEAQFMPGMSWGNWGREQGCWHIDHRRPLASFDLTDRQQFVAASHYSNLQPLWALENLSKGAEHV